MHPAEPESAVASIPGGIDEPALYRQIFHAASDAMLIVDDAGCIRIANARSEALFGYRVDELVGSSIETLIPQRFRESHTQHRARFRSTPRARPMGTNIALTARHRDGHEFAVEISLNPLRVDGAVWTCANVRNVDELRRAQDLIVRARQANAVADFGRLALGTRDFAAIQRQACTLIVEHLDVDLALSARVALAGGRVDVVAQLGFGDDEEIEPLRAQLERLVTDEAERLLDRPMLLERPLLAARSDTTELPTAIACAIPGEEDRCLGLLMAGSRSSRSFSRDDGSFVQALANTVGAALQREGAEARLFQSQRLEALGQLTGGVAHDFNNLLTVVSGNLQMLEDRIVDDALGVRLAKAALRATSRGADLTRKLLAFSRRQTLQPRAIDVAQLLDSIVDILRRTLGAKIDVRLEVEDDLPPAKADPGMLDTALLNLAVNARDAMPDGGRLTLSASRLTAGGNRLTAGGNQMPAGGNQMPAGANRMTTGANQTSAMSASANPAPHDGQLVAGDYVRIAVIDTGSGMPPEVLARAFEPFFTTKESGKGSGLGLSLVYGFAKQSGGHIDVRSAPGTGTSIALYLPADDGSSAPRARRARGADYAGGKETILVVEDDDEVRSVAVGFLDKLGYRVLQAADARQALERIDSGAHVDLLFTDVVMRGELDGPALAREALRRRPGLRVVFTSGHAPESIALLERRAGAELLSKPYRIDDLARILRRALEAPAPAGPTPRPAGTRER